MSRYRPSKYEQRPSTDSVSTKPTQSSQQMHSPEVICFLMAVEIERLLNENEEIYSKQQQSSRANEETLTLRRRNTDLEKELTSQMENYQFKIDELNQSVEEWRFRFQQQQIEHQNQLQQAKRNEESKKIIEQKNKELEQWEDGFNKLEQEFNQQSFQLQQIESKVVMLSTENERLHLLSKKSDELKKTIQEKENEILSWEDGFNKLEAEYNEKTEQFQQMENKLVLLSTENERLLKQLKQKSEEIKQIKQEYELDFNQLQQDCDHNIQLLQEKDSQITKITQQYHECLEYERLYSNAQSQVESSEDKIIMLSQEIERLNKVLKEKHLETERIRNEVQDDSKLLLLTQIEEIDRVNNILTLKVRENNELKSRQQKLQLDVQSLRMNEYKILDLTQTVEELSQQNQLLLSNDKDYDDFREKNEKLKQKIVLLTKEIERLNQVIISGHSELDQSRKTQKMFEDKIAQQTLQIQQLIDQQNIIEQEKASIRYELANQRRFDNEYSTKVALLSSEIERLNQIVTKKNQQIQQDQFSYQEELDKLSSQLAQERQMKNKVEFLNENKEKLENENQALKHKLAQYEQRITLLAEEIERLNLILSKKDNELRLQTRKPDQERQITQLQVEVENLQFQMNLKNQELDQIRRNEQGRLQKDKFNEERLLKGKYLSQEIDRLTVLNEENEFELKELRMKYTRNIDMERKLQDQQCILVLQQNEIESLRQRLNYF